MSRQVKMPEISRLSPCNPGETLQLFGENLEACDVYVWQPPTPADAPASFEPLSFPAKPADAVKLHVTGSSEQVLYAAMPYIEPGCMLVWAVNEAGGAAGVVNRPEIWSQSLAEAIPGDRFALFGRSFFGFDNRQFSGTRCVLRSEEDGRLHEAHWGSSQDLQQFMPGQNDHKSEYMLPGDLPPGSYRLVMSNGTGGAWGWSDPVRLTVAASRTLTGYCRMKWNYDCRRLPAFDMRTVAQARIPASLGDGLTDATDVLQNAVDELAGDGGGLLLLPAGRYGVSRMLTLKPGVVLKGAGMGATTLTVTEGAALERTGMPPAQYASRAHNAKNWGIDWKPYLDRDNNTPLVWIETDAGMEDLKIEGGNGAAVLVCVGTSDGRPSEGVFFNRVHVDNAVNAALFMKGGYTMAYHGILTTGYTNDFTLYKCRVEAYYTLFMLPAKNVRLRLVGNDFEVSPRQTGDNVYLGGTYDAMIVENNFRYGRRTLMCQQGFAGNYVFQNRSEGVANTTNANEEYMSEYGHGSWIGTAAGIDGRNVIVGTPIDEIPVHAGGTLKDNLKEHIWQLLILRGRGFGQYRRVISVRADTIEVDRPWDVTPDESTQFLLMTGAEHNVWADNFAGTGSGNSQFIYGAGLENAITCHSMLMASGMTLYAFELERDDIGNLREMGAVAFNQIVGCDARYSGMGLCLWTNQSWSTLDDMPIESMNIFGNLIRWNSMTGGADSDYVKNQHVWMPVELPSGIQMVGNYNLMEKNLLAGFDAGIHVRASSVGNLIAGNRFRHNACDVRDDGSSTVVVGSLNEPCTLEKPGVRPIN